jgi:para-nitrobenzyl esterase
VVIDGYVLPESMQDIFAGDRQTTVPLLTGYNADDLVFTPPATLAGFKEYVRSQFSTGDTADIFRLYPATTDKDAATAARDLARDAGFGLQNFAWACMQSKSGRANVYMYFFNRKVPEFGGKNVYGAFHSGEICYAYDNLKFLNRPLIDTDHALAATMSAYWVNFVSTGNPNGGTLPAWPLFTRNKGEVMIFDTRAHAGRHPDLDQLNFLYQRALGR